MTDVKDFQPGVTSMTQIPQKPFGTISTGTIEPQQFSPQLRAPARSDTATIIAALNSHSRQPTWKPGHEPGLDPFKPNGGRKQAPILHEECQITVVDFSVEDMRVHELDNEGFIELMDREKDSWVKCRWINVNGLSWDVISAVGKVHKLHKLAIEDMINTHNRTKADWYTDHLFMVLTLQKIVHTHLDGASKDSDARPTPQKPQQIGISKLLHKILPTPNSALEEKREAIKAATARAAARDAANGFVVGHTDGLPDAPLQKLRTLQRYHEGPNKERMEYMEMRSPLTKRRQAISAEQVSIFLTSDNTVICFFESSADDIEPPIIHRLSSPDTILRKSCDASMIMQAILDAIIDLFIPVVSAYQEIIGDIELDVLMEPSIKHTKKLYIVTSEMSTMRNFFSPINSLLNILRDHKAGIKSSAIPGDEDVANDLSKAVKISPMARTYLSDVEDHAILMTESLDQMRSTCDNLIGLIFNTISAYQNASMKQLTLVTIIFLPSSFITGYMGMNFESFSIIEKPESYFWEISLPVVALTILLLMKDVFRSWHARFMRKRGIARSQEGKQLRQWLADQNM